MPSATLTINDTTNRFATLNNTDQISTSDSNPIHTRTCGNILSLASNTVGFLSEYKISNTSPTPANDTYTNVNQFVADLGTLTSGTVVSNSIGNSPIVNIYLPYLEDVYLPVLQNVKNCLQESSIPDYNKLKDQRQVTDESKSRFESIKNPERQVSYFEGWFPLVRPISERALFLLFGIGMAFMLLAVGVFLRLSGVQISFIMPTFTSEYGTSDYTKYLPLGGIAGVIVGILMWGYYNRGWFGGQKQ